jgi:hypothetical protein
MSRLVPRTSEVRRLGLVALALAVAAAVIGCTAAPSRVARIAAAPPAIRHVFVINLENEGYDRAFESRAAPYLSQTLVAKGQRLSRYYGTAHHSLPNYIAQISGQGPNLSTQHDCGRFTRFHLTGTAAHRQAVGRGCVYPRSVSTIADQLRRHGLRWRAYMEDMGRSCRHPALGARDRTQKARPNDMYAARHNPFVYFRSLTSTGACARNDVRLRHLRTDLRSVASTRNLSYITPNLCHDGHDSPCANGARGGLASADKWLRRWVPRILASPAFRRNGLLVVTFDEAENGDASACCGEGAGPNTPLPGLTGKGGGRTGAVLVSRFIAPGTKNPTRYNHYSLLRTMERIFGLPALGYAASAPAFGADVWSAS